MSRWTIALAAACAACGYNLAAYPDVTPALDAPILTYAEYGAIEHAEPYVLRFGQGAGAVVYFGSRHTQDPDNAQIDSIRALWSAFRPTVALAEARKGWRGSLDGNVKQFGESAALVALARDAGIPVYTLDAPLEAELGAVLARWPKERVLLFYILRSYTSRAVSRRSDGEARDLLGERGKWPGLEGAFSSIEEMDSVWARESPGGSDWRRLPWQSTWPGRDDGWLNRVATDVNRFRDQHMVALIAQLVRSGERVFAVVGSSHVVMQEAALRAALDSATD